MTHLRYDGFRVPHKGVHQGGGEFVSYGHLCRRNTNSPNDKHVGIYFVPSVGYQYEE